MDLTIKIENLSKKYGNQFALKNISLELKSGEIVGLLGPNGAGKSTLMKILPGYLKPSSGSIFVNDLSLSENVFSIQQQMGYLPEHNPLYTEMFVREYLQFNAAIHQIDKTEVENVIEKVGLKPEVHKKIHQLSKGYRQRVGLAAAILHNPSILILDEPTTGLDPNQIEEIRQLIKDLGRDRIVLFSSHILQEVEAVCDRVIILHKGKMLQDLRLNQIRSTEQQLLEVEFDLRVEEQFLKTLPNLIKVENVFDATWELTFQTNEDMRPVLVDFAQLNGLRALKIISKNKSLADLFKELTAN
ncbi:MAG: gliding motility-associated ABC transporter ATP-binding subunit GldA [Flavobacteriaceae bacterium]|nr:gliding motility-associated ABC transporter ATP-binding subunit GldA [Flavobacteriaceae bacterium]